MTDTETKQLEKYQKVSALSQDPTYGERLYETVFHHGINFWFNLVTSAAFTYWVSHSKNPIKLPFVEHIPQMPVIERIPVVRNIASFLTREHRAPSVIQKSLAENIEKFAPLRAFGTYGSEMRNGVAKTMAGVFTLTTAGHFVMIPSVWLGAKIKASFVKNADRKHYGAEAMEDPALKLRHAMIEAEERPTLFGTVLGRAGTILATQTTAYTVGNATQNIPRIIGTKFNIPFLKKFTGIDHFTEMAGDKIGGAVGEMIPGTEKLNERIRTLGPKGYDFSNAQHDHFAELGVGPLKYGQKVPHPTDPKSMVGGGFAEHFGKYLVSDVMYTAVTSVTIMPAINFMKKFIPFMTYKPTLNAETQAILDTAQKLPKLPRHRPSPLAETAPQTANENIHTANDDLPETPASKISHAHHQSHVHARELQVGA